MDDTNQNSSTVPVTPADPVAKEPSFIDNTHPTTPAAVDELLNLEELIKNYVTHLTQLKDELKKQRDFYEDSFESDAVFKEQEDKAKEANKIKAETKKQILKQPVLASISDKITDMRTEIKELETNLSDYLLQYQKMTGFNQIELGDGETMLIVQSAKLVKGSSQK